MSCSPPTRSSTSSRPRRSAEPSGSASCWTDDAAGERLRRRRLSPAAASTTAPTPNTLARNEHIRTNALHAAAASENKGGQTRYELCELLLKHGADPSIPQGGNEFRAIDSARLDGDERLERLLGS